MISANCNKSLQRIDKKNFTCHGFYDTIDKQLKTTANRNMEKYPSGRRGAPAKGVVRG